MNERYAEPLCGAADVTRLCGLVGGHPYLVRRCLHEMKTRNMDIVALETEAGRDDGLFGDHLDRIRVALQKDAGLLSVVRGLLNGESSLTPESFSRPRAAGVILGASPAEAGFRCRLYETYLRRHLL